jgi:hypothetical protein
MVLRAAEAGSSGSHPRRSLQAGVPFVNALSSLPLGLCLCLARSLTSWRLLATKLSRQHSLCQAYLPSAGTHPGLLVCKRKVIFLGKYYLSYFHKACVLSQLERWGALSWVRTRTRLTSFLWSHLEIGQVTSYFSLLECGVLYPKLGMLLPVKASKLVDFQYPILQAVTRCPLTGVFCQALESLSHW